MALTDFGPLRQQLDGTVVEAGDARWDEARQGFNLAREIKPAAVAIPACDADVVATVRFARGAGIRIAAQGTAHNAGSLADLGDAILLRTTAMKGVEIDREAQRARARAGAVWSDLVPQASEQGLAALHGSAPGIGIVGYSISGGVGWYSRRHGLACNRVTAAEVVTADGELRRVDGDDEPELFWALRGGGGSFGVVTNVEFELLELPQVYAGALFFPFERAFEVLHAWREWTASMPEEMTSVGRVMQFPPIEDLPEQLRGKAFAIVEAILIGDEATGEELTAPLRDLGPLSSSLGMVPPAGIADLHMDPPGPVTGITDHMLLDDLPPAAIDSLLAVAGPGSGSRLTSVEIRHGGGALARNADDHGALSKLPGSYVMFAVGSTMDPAAVVPTQERMAQVMAALEPYDAGRYLSFCEHPTDLATAFGAETVTRLRSARAAYDPDGLFQASHEVVA